MNWNHEAKKILITGKSGSGKTSLWLGFLRDWRCRYKFVFDPDLEVCRRLGWHYSNSPETMTQAIKLGLPVCYRPDDMFPGDRARGFDYFCRWSLASAKMLRGPKVLAVDEVWKFVDCRKPVPQSFAEILDDGRKDELDLLLVSQRPNKTHEAIRASLTEIITFHHSDRRALDWIEEDGFDREAVRALAYPGGYLRLSAINAPNPPGKRNRQASAEG